jgi:hypothetical protein
MFVQCDPPARAGKFLPIAQFFSSISRLISFPVLSCISTFTFHFVAHTVHVHRAAGDADGGVTLEIGALQPFHDGMDAVVLAAMAALATGAHAFPSVRTCRSTMPAFAARSLAFAAMGARRSALATAHFVPTATAMATTAPAHAAAQAANDKAQCEREQAEEEDLGPVGVHGGKGSRAVGRGFA